MQKHQYTKLGILALVLTLLLGVSDTVNAFLVLTQNQMTGVLSVTDSRTHDVLATFNSFPVIIDGSLVSAASINPRTGLSDGNRWATESPIIVPTNMVNVAAILITGPAADTTSFACAEVAGAIVGPGTDIAVATSGTVLGSAGIRLDNVFFASVSDCTFIGFGQGIELINSNSNQFLRNVVVRNREDGIDFNSSFSNRFEQNVVSGNGEDGIDLNDSNGNTFFQNSVVSNLRNGIDLENSDFNSFASNTLCRNGGVNFTQDAASTGNTVTPSFNPLCGQ